MKIVAIKSQHATNIDKKLALLHFNKEKNEAKSKTVFAMSNEWCALTRI